MIKYDLNLFYSSLTDEYLFISSGYFITYHWDDVLSLRSGYLFDDHILGQVCHRLKYGGGIDGLPYKLSRHLNLVGLDHVWVVPVYRGGVRVRGCIDMSRDIMRFGDII